MLDLLEQYTRDRHLSSLESNLPASLSLTNLETIFSSSWDSQNDPPYIVTTCLLDSYYCLPERPDMAFVHLWMAFNNSYNHLFQRNNYRDLNRVISDSKGLNASVNAIHAQLSTMIPGETGISVGNLLFEYIQRIPTKTLRFIGNLLLKGLAIEQANPQISKLFQSRSYNSLKKKFPEIVNPIFQTYGEAYLHICNVTFDSTDLTINMGITDLGLSRSISHSLGLKLKELICNKTVELFDRSDNDQKLTIMLSKV